MAEARGEATRAGQLFKFFAGETLRQTGDLTPSVRPGMTVEVTREPVGIVGIITPWNFPLAIPAWKIGPALAWGNTVVFKPASNTPGCAWELVNILVRAGLPAGVLNLVYGGGSVVGSALTESGIVDAISFTGSTSVGNPLALAAVRQGIRVQTEMGGKNPMIVLDDADLDLAVEACINGAYFSTGQRCTASSRLIVTKGIHDRFVAALEERMRGMKVGHALDPLTEVGPVVDQSQLDRDRHYLEIAAAEGGRGGRARDSSNARLLHGASAREGHDQSDDDQPRRGLRPGRLGHRGRGLRGCARHRERHPFRLEQRNLHDVAQPRSSL
jgi:acyl-CoA reductase-like NAD-dependent aldehyde dehydrogenase